MDHKTKEMSDIASIVVGRIDIFEHDMGREGLDILGASIAYNAAIETVMELERRGLLLTNG
jgi:hypothetical protein